MEETVILWGVAYSPSTGGTHYYIVSATTDVTAMGIIEDLFELDPAGTNSAEPLVDVFHEWFENGISTICVAINPEDM